MWHKHEITNTIKALLKDIRQTLFPWSKIEILLFWTCFFFYGIIGFELLFRTGILDARSTDAGSYLGYDHLYLLHTRGGFYDFCHPFFMGFHIAKYIITQPLQYLFGDKAAPVVCLLLMNTLVCSALVFLYRYLRQIIQLPVARSLLLTLFTACFFTTIVLSFTIETYTFSFCLLVFSLLMLSREYKQTNGIQRRTLWFLTCLCGGVTITNAIKPTMAVLLKPTSWKDKIYDGIKTMLPFVVCVVLISSFFQLKSLVLAPEVATPMDAAIAQNRYFIFNEKFTKHAFVDFWGNTILTTHLVPQKFDRETVLRPSTYDTIWQNFTMAFLLLLLVASAFLNRNNWYVQLLLLYLSVDIFIHFILRYGINEGIIFGGHWMFTVPLLLGWLYTHLSGVVVRILDGLILILLVQTIWNNGMEFMYIWKTLIS